MAYARMAATRQLDDEYETKQLNPKYGDSKKDEASSERIEELADKLPEKDSLKLRMAVCEAIVDDLIANEIEQNDGKVNVETIEDTLEPVVEKAIALHIVPRQMKDRLNKMIAKHLRYRDPMIALHAKVAHYLTDSVVRMEEEDTVISEVLDDKPADTGFDIQEEKVEPTTPAVTVDRWKPKKRRMESSDGHIDDYNGEENGLVPDEPKEESHDVIETADMRWRMEDDADTGSDSSSDSDDEGSDIQDAVQSDSQDDSEKDATGKEDVVVEADLPKTVEDSMRFLAASAVNHRKATALVSRKIGGVMLVNTLYKLRNCLPDSYKRKYRMI